MSKFFTCRILSTVRSASAIGTVGSATLGRHDRSAPPTAGWPFCRWCPLLRMAAPLPNASTATSAWNVTSQTSTSRRVAETSITASLVHHVDEPGRQYIQRPSCNLGGYGPMSSIPLYGFLAQALECHKILQHCMRFVYRPLRALHT